MDHATASYEQMMAYQYGVERSRTFEAFKRAREGEGAHAMAANGASPGGATAAPRGAPPVMGNPLGMGPYGGMGAEEDAHALKRPRLVWTPALHKRFVDAVTHLGVKNAVPKTIMQLMNVEGLTRENVASHLQKYRLYLKRLSQ